MTELPDNDLLRRFSQSRDEGAFAEIVRRHIHHVYSAACRLTHNPHLAEDVTQGAFIALAQNPRQVASKLQNGAPLSAWLHLTTRNIAANTIRSEVRRKARETKAASLNTPPDSGPPCAWEELALHLDHALGELSEPDRHALFLRFFERKTANEIGQRLGLTEEAAQKRVRRALESLRTTFARRGLATTVPALGALLTSQAIQAAPAALASTLASTALAAAATAAPTAILSVASFAMTKTQAALSLALVSAIVIPLAIQRSTLGALRQARAALPQTFLPAIQSRAQQSPPPQAAQSEADEIARLRATAADLRLQIAARQQPRPAPTGVAPAEHGPTLLVQGRKTSILDLVFAGNSTPEAALQSLLFCQREGDIDRAFSLMLFPPSKVEEIQALLSDPEQKETMARMMRGALFGMVRSQTAVTSGNDLVPGDIIVRDKWPASLDGELSVEIIGIEPIDDRRVHLKTKVVRGAETREESLTFGQTSNGWKQLP